MLKLEDTPVRGRRDKSKEDVGWRAQTQACGRQTKTNKGQFSPSLALLLLCTSMCLWVPVCSAAHAAEGEHCSDELADPVSSKKLLQSARPKMWKTSKESHISFPVDEKETKVLAKDTSQVPQEAAPHEARSDSSGSARPSATGFWNSVALLCKTWAERGIRSTALDHSASSVLNLMGGSAGTDAVVASLVYAMLVVFFCIFLLGFAFYFLARRVLSGDDADKERELGEQDQQHSVPPSQQVLLRPEELYLCPDLVVPAGCECVLLVPTQPKPGQPYDITDSTGNCVLSVADCAGRPLRRKLVANGNHDLAQCGRVQQAPSTPTGRLSTIEFELINATGEAWAQLSYEPRQGAEDKCTIKTKRNETLQIFGSVRHNALNMTNTEGGQLLATTEPMVEVGPHGEPPCSMFRMRVAPLTDVGLVLCSLICLKHLSISV
eukprot:TRINITY_DN31166_c0_g2_i1.p1 TRINITY_DN31166_c0_g2~~TRINITY_DN31166_c0_g2_i1.p1  ORF type:complete len:436 (-),score=69.19 TRINITY_DN31166_c0_g2_i1:120-1427(-)